MRLKAEGSDMCFKSSHFKVRLKAEVYHLFFKTKHSRCARKLKSPMCSKAQVPFLYASFSMRKIENVEFKIHPITKKNLKYEVSQCAYFYILLKSLQTNQNTVCKTIIYIYFPRRGLQSEMALIFTRAP